MAVGWEPQDFVTAPPLQLQCCTLFCGFCGGRLSTGLLQRWSCGRAGGGVAVPPRPPPGGSGHHYGGSGQPQTGWWHGPARRTAQEDSRCRSGLYVATGRRHSEERRLRPVGRWWVPEAGHRGLRGRAWVWLWLDGGQCRPRPSHCTLRLHLLTTNHTGLATTLGERGLLVFSTFR